MMLAMKFGQKRTKEQDNMTIHPERDAEALTRIVTTSSRTTEWFVGTVAELRQFMEAGSIFSAGAKWLECGQRVSITFRARLLKTSAGRPSFCSRLLVLWFFMQTGQPLFSKALPKTRPENVSRGLGGRVGVLILGGPVAGASGGGGGFFFFCFVLSALGDPIGTSVLGWQDRR